MLYRGFLFYSPTYSVFKNKPAQWQMQPEYFIAKLFKPYQLKSLPSDTLV